MTTGEIVAIVMAVLALVIAKISDKRMQAMARLEFYEKMAVLQSYLSRLSGANAKKQDESEAQQIFYDLVAAQQLKCWVRKSEVANEFVTNITKLKDSARANGKNELASKLDEFLQKYKS